MEAPSGMDLAALSSSPQRPPTTIEVVRPAPDAAAKPERSLWQRAFGADGFSFGTLLDIVNPLQHIPVVSTIYQKLTGDETSPGANIIGGALFGGTIGLIVAAADSALQGETGKDAGGHVFALFDSAQPANVAVAAADDAEPNMRAATVVPDNADATASDSANEAQDAKPDSGAARMADTPALVPAPDAPKSDVPRLAAAAEAPARSAFVRANSMRHTPSHGVGGAFVPFETRSTIAPPSLFAQASFGGFAAPVETTGAKRAGPDKSASTAAPDPRMLAANPDQIKKFKANGMRPTPTRPVPLASAFANAPTLPSAVDNAVPRADVATRDGSGDGFADLMARNIERYMSLKNKRPTPSRVNQSF